MQDKLQKMPYTQHSFAISVSDLRTLFCCKNYLCTFLSQKEFVHTFFVSRTVRSCFIGSPSPKQSLQSLFLRNCQFSKVILTNTAWLFFSRSLFHTFLPSIHRRCFPKQYLRECQHCWNPVAFVEIALIVLWKLRLLLLRVNLAIRSE